MTNEQIAAMAVIDPTSDDQWALRSAINIAKVRRDDAVYAFLCASSTLKSDRPDQLAAVEQKRHVLWLDDLLSRFSDCGVEVRPVVESGDDWRDAVCRAAEDLQVEFVVKRASLRPKALGSSDRYLIRNLRSPLLLVKNDPDNELRKILVAVDFNASDASHLALNESILELGQRIRGQREQVELHSVSAYTKSENFMHPPNIAKELDIDRADAHVTQGTANEVIPQMANKIDADLVVVGSVGRQGLSGITIGNTAEKILVDINADVLVIVREEGAERSAA